MHTFVKPAAKLLLTVSLLLQLAPAATATQLCEYEIYSPNVLSTGIVYRLAEAGLAAQPDGTRSSRDQRMYPVLRAPNALAGTMTYMRDLTSRASSVVFRTADGSVLLEANETLSPCPRLRPSRTCYETTFHTAFAGGEPDDKPAFSIVDGEYGMEFFRFGEPVRSLQWRSEFTALIDWLVEYYAESADVQTVVLRSPFAAIEFAISADPLLAPYRDYIHISRDRDARLVVSGRVASNAQHSALLQKFFDIGIWNVQSWVVIDTGFVLPFDRLQPAIEACL
jgi:hypothetical protein